MTRVRFDPTFIEHQRWEELGADAFIQHVAACSFVVRTLSDGIVTRARVRTLTPLVRNPLRVAQRLVDGGVWQQLEDGSYLVCACIDDLRRADGRGDEQPSAAFVSRERERARDRKAAWQARQNGRRNGGRNAVPNGAQSSADQSRAVQGTPSPSPLHPAADDEVNVDEGPVRSEAEAKAAARAALTRRHTA